VNNGKVKLHRISVKYQSADGETEAIRDVSLCIREGEFVSIVGPSGCGKSTILNLISGLLRPTAGDVQVSGQVGYMLQHDHLFEWRTILGNCLIGPEVQGQNLKQAKRQVMRLLQTYGLSDFINHYPRQLSGGMRQRAALIRTLTVNPDVVLLDEAFAALDYQTRLRLVDEVWMILKKERKTALIVTHDIAEAISMSDRVIVLSGRPAQVRKEFGISFSTSGQTPLANRMDEKFRHYFNDILKELDVND
jgi:NitT/TauT family transport system ATP-binding protein